MQACDRGSGKETSLRNNSANVLRFDETRILILMFLCLLVHHLKVSRSLFESVLSVVVSSLGALTGVKKS